MAIASQAWAAIDWAMTAEPLMIVVAKVLAPDAHFSRSGLGCIYAVVSGLKKFSPAW